MEGGRARATETDQISVYFFSKKQWYTVKPRYPADYVGEPFGARQRHVACFFETHNPIARPTRPPVPCLFIHGGFRRHQVRVAVFVALSGQFIGIEDKDCNNKADGNTSMDLNLSACSGAWGCMGLISHGRRPVQAHVPRGPVCSFLSRWWGVSALAFNESWDKLNATNAIMVPTGHAHSGHSLGTLQPAKVALWCNSTACR